MTEREIVTMTDDDGSVIGIGCKLDQSQCDHEFTDTNDPDSDYCIKCGTTVWAWAFMECP